MYKHSLKHILLFFVIVAGFGAIVMLLWNWLIPAIFGLGAINFWQALGLLALSRLFFGGFGKFWLNHRINNMRHHRSPMFEKWAAMNEEQRKEFIKHRNHLRYARDFSNNCQK